MEIWINVGSLGTDTVQFGFLSPTELHLNFQSLSKSPSLDLTSDLTQLFPLWASAAPVCSVPASVSAAVILSIVKTIFLELFHLVSYGFMLFLGNLLHKHIHRVTAATTATPIFLFIITSPSPAA